MYVAGIDAHTRYLVVVVVSKFGDRVAGPVRVKAGEAEPLLEVLRSYRPVEVVVETSSFWPWLHDVVVAEGIGFVLAHAKRLRAIAEQSYKRDEVDAELLARIRLAGLIPEVWPKTVEQREWARLLRHRQALVRQRTQMAARIHAQLHAVGCKLKRGRLLTRAGREWVRTEAWADLSPEQRCLFRMHSALIDRLRPMIRTLDRRIGKIAAQIPEAVLLQTIPGIGAYRSLLLVTEVAPVTRFPRAAHLVSYAGLAPTSRKSGQRPVHHGRIPKGANRQVRGALVRTVVSHVRHGGDRSWLGRYYERQKARLGWPVARVATARKLAQAIHAMLRTGEPWQNERPVCGLETKRGELRESHVAPTTSMH